MRCSLPAAIIALPLIICAPGMAQAQQAATDARYAECSRQVRLDAQEAYKAARAWYGQSQSTAAQHCMALALFELRNYAEAATMLDDILRRVPRDQARLWLSMKSQSARAHLAAGNVAPAEAHVTEALHWALERSFDTELQTLLVLRAQILNLRGQNLKALQDLDHAVSLGYASAVQLQRAKLFLQMGMKPSARADIEHVLRTEPDNAEALSLQQAAAH